jgi:hypothetical protein
MTNHLVSFDLRGGVTRTVVIAARNPEHAWDLALQRERIDESRDLAPYGRGHARKAS